ncbi:uncharacterized protein LOC110700377 [Chenopodium quinoa]|uniref:Wall-associated receptor kinase galacturonan-binding domain-containing protein n=1 Tax=Chenopodium quinoa TaxID=63459 RepID=A0A803L8K4_CHEQI|nr:uncharacterized protein LOC110700377 [Chenopodium quinoa]
MHHILSLLFALLLTIPSFPLCSSYNHSNTCRSYCGNISIDYPFGLKYGCGHPGYRDLLYCINDVLMLHVASGSYRVLDIDYTFQALTLHDPHLSTCNSIVLGSKGNGFVVESWRAPFLTPAPDNAFLLIGCSAKSLLFQGLPSKHLACRNVSGLGCEDYYRCPAWGSFGPKTLGLGPPECCAVAYGDLGPNQGINLTKLDCQGYSSAYSLAPLRIDGPHEWSYGIRVKYSVQGHDAFCKTCEATRGTCGYSGDNGSEIRELCFCGTRNSTSSCDSITSVESMISKAITLKALPWNAIVTICILISMDLWNKG